MSENKKRTRRHRKANPSTAEETLEDGPPRPEQVIVPVLEAANDGGSATMSSNDRTANDPNNTSYEGKNNKHHHETSNGYSRTSYNDPQGGNPELLPAEQIAATPPPPPPVPSAPASSSDNPRTLTRAEALAQLRKNGPAAIQKAALTRSSVPTGGAQAEGARRPNNRDNSDQYSSSGSETEEERDEAEHSVGSAFLPKRQEGESVGRTQGNHRPSSSTAAVGQDKAADSVFGTGRRGEDRGDGEEAAPEPPSYAGEAHAAGATLPANAHQDSEGVKMTRTNVGMGMPNYPPDDPNSLPRMLRLQRTFETNMSRLYSFCALHVTEWPALAVEWMPDRKFDDPERDYTLQYVAIGTQTIKGAPNQVKVMEIAVPNDSGAEAMYGLYGDDDIGPQDSPELQPEVDPGKLFKNVRGHFRCEQSITVDTTVLKIRAMPAETNILAVTTGSGFIGVFNLVQDQTENEKGETIPDAILYGHSMGGFGLSWNLVKPGLIASGADDGYLNYWDISHRITVDLKDGADKHGDRGGAGGLPDLEGIECEPVQKLSGHRDIITDVSWHATQGHLLSSASLDGDVRLWDIRTHSTTVTMHSAHAGGATASQFHPVGAFQLATAGSGGELCFWDIRRPKYPLMELAYHGRAVTGLQWAPFNETVIASYGEDGRVVIWDLGKTSLPLEYSADALAPPEVSFVHIGHLGVVTDASWCPGKGDDWLMASTDSFNGVHTYKPKESVVRDYVPRELW